MRRMSRLGRMPITIPDGVKATIDGGRLEVEGPKGRLSKTIHPSMRVVLKEKKLLVERSSDSRIHKSLHGLTRTLISNMVRGVTEGHEKNLEVRGVGYKAEVKEGKVLLHLGHSHPIEMELPKGIFIEVGKGPMVDELPTLRLKVKGLDKELVGMVTARIRSIAPPEPYKGKGIRYQGEMVKRKAGKAAAV